MVNKNIVLGFVLLMIVVSVFANAIPELNEIVTAKKMSLWDYLMSPFTVTDSTALQNTVVKGDPISFKFQVYPKHVSEKSRFDIKLVSVVSGSVSQVATISSYFYNQPMDANTRYILTYDNFPTSKVSDNFCNARMGFIVDHYNYYNGQYNLEKDPLSANSMSGQFVLTCPSVPTCSLSPLGDKFCQNDEVRQKWQDSTCTTYNKLISLCGSGCINGECVSTCDNVGQVAKTMCDGTTEIKYNYVQSSNNIGCVLSDAIKTENSVTCGYSSGDSGLSGGGIGEPIGIPTIICYYCNTDKKIVSETVKGVVCPQYTYDSQDKVNCNNENVVSCKTYQKINNEGKCTINFLSLLLSTEALKDNFRDYNLYYLIIGGIILIGIIFREEIMKKYNSLRGKRR